jgi:hypothetical protein
VAHRKTMAVRSIAAAPRPDRQFWGGRSIMPRLTSRSGA